VKNPDTSEQNTLEKSKPDFRHIRHGKAPFRQRNGGVFTLAASAHDFGIAVTTGNPPKVRDEDHGAGHDVPLQYHLNFAIR
jgi:hypothetical protein